MIFFVAAEFIKSRECGTVLTWKNPSRFTEMICFSQKTPGFYSSNGLFKVNTRKIPLSNHENRGGSRFWDRDTPTKSLAHRRQPTGSVLALNLVVARWAKDAKKTFCPSQKRFKTILEKAWTFFPQQQNAMGSLHNIDFGVCWASWGGSGKKRVPGKFRESSGNRSGNRLGSRFQEPVPRFQGLDRFQGSRFQEPVPRLG